MTAVSAVDGRRDQAVLIRNITVLAGSQVITWTASLAWALIVPRSLGAQGTGVFTLSVAASQMIGVFIGLGMAPLLVREISINRERAPRLLATAIVLRLALAVPALGALALLARLAHFEGDELVGLYLGWGVAAVYALYGPFQAALQAIERMQYLAYSDVITKTGVIVISIVLVLVGLGAISLLSTTVAVMAGVLVLNFVWIRRYFHLQWRVTASDVRNLVMDSLPYCGFAIFFNFYLWIDSLMLGVMTSVQVVGWYGMPTKLFGTLMFLPVILSTAWLPRLAAAHRQESDEPLSEAARSPLEIVVALSLPVCAGVILLAGPVIHFLYGPDFDQSAPIMTLLALSVPPMYLNIMVNQVLVAANRQMVWTKAMGVACVVNPALNLILIPYFQRTHGNGGIGAGLSLLITELVLAGIAVVAVRSCFRGSFVGRTVRAAAATAGMAGAMLLAQQFGFVAQLVVGLLVYPLLAWGFRVVAPDELRQLLEMVKSVRKSRRSDTPAPA